MFMKKNESVEIIFLIINTYVREGISEIKGFKNILDVRESST